MRRALWPVSLLGVALGFVALFDGGETVTWTALVNRAVGGSFMVCGLIVWARRPDTRTGVLMWVTGFLYLGSELLDDSGSSLLHTCGEATAVVWLAALAALALGYPTGKLSGRYERALVIAWVFGTLVWQVVWLLFEPVPANAFALWPDAQTADAIDTAQRWFNTTIGTLVAIVCLARWWRAAPALRELLLPTLAGGVAIAVLAVQSYYRLLAGEFMRPTQEITAVVLFLVPLAFLWGMMRAQMARAGMADLIVALQRAPDPTHLGALLAKSLRDPSLTLVYWVPGYDTYVDTEGMPVAPPTTGRAVTPIEHDGRRVAALIHDPALSTSPSCWRSCARRRTSRWSASACRPSWSRACGSSRARGAAGGGRGRGAPPDRAQPARRCAAAARLAGDRPAGHRGPHHPGPRAGQELVAAARRELTESLAELRELARGIHPAVLEHGLDPALQSLAMRSPTPVR